MESIITHPNWEEYLVRLYFGEGTDYLILALKRAYFDFNRTLHGIREIKSQDKLLSEAHDLIYHAFTQLQSHEMQVTSQKEFDDWHSDLCSQLADLGRRHGYASFFIGQAQKWINMTFKYVFTLGEERLPGYNQFYAWCHVPLDNVLLGKLNNYGFKGLSCAWSRLNDYQTYLSCQQWVRERFALLPMDVEFKLWMGEEVKTRT